MKQDYWNARKDATYYREAVEMARAQAPAAKSVLDVGGGGCEYITWADWIPLKVALDPWRARELPGVLYLREEFEHFTPEIRFDLAFCLQVLEHIEDAGAFAQKLLASAETVIISVPYKWPAGYCPGHVQDPVDEEKLEGWTGIKAIESKIITDGTCRRLLAAFRRKA